MASNLSSRLLLKDIQPIESFTGTDGQDPLTWLQTIDELFEATKTEKNDRCRLLPMYFALCTRLNPDMQEDEKILYLLRGLKPSLQQHVIMNEPKKSKDLFEHAKRAEAAAALITQPSPTLTSSVTNEQMNETTAALHRTRISQNSSQNDRRIWNNQSDSNRRWPQQNYNNNNNNNNRFRQFPPRKSSQFKCYNCSGIGHYAYQCPSHLN
ncbi:unnamed protein product [Rotaria sordida]|uniref:CCHC-type domain-containing protein n=1 Tax=Rotaria sordida TaxID=392033 RepID=A0A814SJ55_9BILA|nr:unnamed protein product [Rotaria sordida]CAF1148070.1 unnamed protein product [Rotaria sordida]CAF1156866.1 unnamed protein product [Rotaria sordida]CAF3943263.1 unnamed protein product [Rotaria sordida]